MPLGKSGKYYMNPHEMKRKSDEPGAPKEMPAPGENGDGGSHEDANGEGQGDGMHHHELHEREDGSIHSLHTHPDGSKEEMDHDSYSDARDHMDQMMGDGGEGEEEPDGDEGNPPPPDMSSADDMAGMYEKAGRRG
jgi:hypothetical protein